MNVTVESLAPCRKLLRIEVDAAAVDAAFARIASTFQKQAQLPGFRPGKAPLHLILKSYGASIEEEVKKQLMGDAYRDAVRQEKLNVVGMVDVEEIEFGRGQALKFAATVETAPDFALPEYKGIEIKREVAMVTDADIERAIGVLREQRADYKDVDRAVQDGDFVVVDYTGTSEGKPLTEFAPTARGLTEKKGFWLQVAQDSFVPGFTPQLVGAKAGEARTVNVEFPQDFVSQPLSGKKAEYQVVVQQVKEKILPDLDEAFAVGFGAENLERLREGVRRDLESELNMKLKRSTRDQLVGALLSRVTCDLPEAVVNNETRNVVYDIVRENQQRGVPKEILDQQKDEIFNAANSSAKDRVKISFILGRIAEQEKIGVDDQEITRRVLYLAQQYGIKPEKFVRQLQDRDGISEIRSQILSSKVLDFIELQAKVEEVLPGSAPAAS